MKNSQKHKATFFNYFKIKTYNYIHICCFSKFPRLLGIYGLNCCYLHRNWCSGSVLYHPQDWSPGYSPSWYFLYSGRYNIIETITSFARSQSILNKLPVIETKKSIAYQHCCSPWTCKKKTLNLLNSIQYTWRLRFEEKYPLVLKCNLRKFNIGRDCSLHSFI